MKTHFFNLPLRLASALCLLLLAAGHTAFGAVTFTGDTFNDGTTVIVGDTGEGSLLIDGGSSLSITGDGYVGRQTGSVGNVTLSSGSLTTSWLYVGPGGTGTLNINGGTVIVGANLTKGGNGSIQLNAGGTLQIGAGGDSGNLSVGNLSNNGTLAFNRSTNSTYSDIISGTGAVTKSGNGTLTLNGSNTYTGTTTISAGTLQIGAGGTTGSLTSDITNSGLLRFNRSDNSTYSGIISGTGTVTKLGAGTLTLTGNHTYGNTTTISAGTLQIGAGGTTGSLASSINNDAALIFNRSDDYTYARIISNTGTVTKLGAGTLTLTRNHTYIGATTISAGTLQVGDGGTGGSLSSNITNNTFLAFNRSDNSTYARIISGSGAVTKLGAGTLTLTGNHTYIGATTISSGTLQVGDGGTAGSLTSNITNNAAFAFNRSNNSTYSGIISGSGNVTKSGAGTLTLSGNNTYSGATTISAGTLQIGANGTTGSLASDITNNAALAFNRSDNSTYSGIISGTGTVTKLGASTLTLAGSNTYTGASTISQGTLQIGNGGTTGSLTSNITNNANLVFNRSDNSTYSGIVSGTGAVTKLGAGTLTLNGSNTYTGATTINSGTLQAAATGALGNSTVINVNGGSFLVTAGNAVNDNASVTLAGGTLAVNGTFNESVGLLTLSANSVIDLNGYNGTLRFSGVGTWASTAILAIWNWNGINKNNTPVGDGANNRHIVFTSDTGLDTYLDRIRFYSDNGTSFAGSGFKQGFATGGTEIIAVPETEAWFCAVALLAGLTVQYIRRRAKRI